MTITITPEQIIAAAQKIANATDDAWEYSEADWLVAVEHYLRCMVNDVLADADWHAERDHFTVTRKYDHPTCYAKPAELSIYCAEHCGCYEPDTAAELVLPPAPPWAHDIATAPFAPRPELQSDEQGEYIYLP
jgi:hypothetical protein